MKITIDKLNCQQALSNLDRSTCKKVAGGASVSGRSSSSVVFDNNSAFGIAEAAYFGSAGGGASTRTMSRAEDRISNSLSMSMSQTF